ncbi:MAG: hypothetical protein U0L42_10485 [Methanobrevibacter sp.]|nr:hypothetical protein [Methanobrevibacter sp.]MEE0936088.1 hypothetical protein [Methanobrevibacter sp.]
MKTFTINILELISSIFFTLTIGNVNVGFFSKLAYNAEWKDETKFKIFNS